MNGVAVKLCGQRNRLRAEFHDPSDAPAEWHRPSIAVIGFPIRRQSGLPRNEPTLFQVVIDEVLQQKLIHVRTAAGPRHRPDIIRQYPQRPVAWLGKQYHRRPNSQLPLS